MCIEGGGLCKCLCVEIKGEVNVRNKECSRTRDDDEEENGNLKK